MTRLTNPVSFLMCEPSGFNVRYQINPWMNGNEGKVDTELAQAQWSAFQQKLSQAANCLVMKGSSSWPDLVFTANAALISPEKHTRRAILSRFRHIERQGEEPVFAQWLVEAGFQVSRLPDHISFEGAGDALFDSSGTLWAAVGLRTDIRAHRFIQDMFGCKLETLNLVNPAFYHLDTCFCPLANGYCVTYLDAFDAASQAKIRHAFSGRLIELTVEEANLFCCNAVEANGFLFMSQCTARLEDILNCAGYRVIASSLSEFIKAGGSAKCLTLALQGNSFNR